MITATEARKIADKYIEEQQKNKEILDKYIPLIKKAASEGMYCVRTQDEIDCVSRQVLNRLGYRTRPEQAVKTYYAGCNTETEVVQIYKLIEW